MTEISFPIIDGLTLTPIGVESTFIQPPPVQKFEYAIAFIGNANSAVRWWIGDLANHADQWGDEYVQLLDGLKEDYSNVRQWAWCCQKVPAVIRRTELEFSHHYAVAGQTVEKQIELLDWCEESGATVKQLKQKIKDETEPPTFDTAIELAKVESVIERIAEKWPEAERGKLADTLIHWGNKISEER